MIAQDNQTFDVSIANELRTARWGPGRGDAAPVMALTSADEFYAFADFRLFPRRRALYCGPERVAIGGRAFDLLLLLVSRAGTIVSAGELIGHVWRNLIVDETNLRVQIGLLRKILARGEEPQHAIETVSLRGYCFTLSVAHYPEGLHLQTANAPARVTMRPLSGLATADGALEPIEAALQARQLVTIAGPACAGGKTIAIAAAQPFASAIHFIDLSQARDRAGAICAIAAAVGRELQGDAVAGLAEQLQNVDALLLLT